MDPLTDGSLPLVLFSLYGILGMPAMLVLCYAYAWLEDRGVTTTDVAGIAGWIFWPAALVLVASEVYIVWCERYPFPYALRKRPPRATAHHRTKR